MIDFLIRQWYAQQPLRRLQLVSVELIIAAADTHIKATAAAAAASNKLQ